MALRSDQTSVAHSKLVSDRDRVLRCGKNQINISRSAVMMVLQRQQSMLGYASESELSVVEMLLIAARLHKNTITTVFVGPTYVAVRRAPSQGAPAVLAAAAWRYSLALYSSRCATAAA